MSLLRGSQAELLNMAVLVHYDMACFSLHMVDPIF